MENKYRQISIQGLSVSTRDKRYLLQCNGSYYEASQLLVELILVLQCHNSREEGIFTFIHQNRDSYTMEQIEDVISRYIDPLLTQSTVSIERKKVFLYEKEILSASVVGRFSGMFCILFNNYYMMAVLLISLLFDIYFTITTKNLFQFNNQVNVYSILGLLVFMLVSSLFHELGHASACKYFGIQHGAVGFGLYLNFPVLYTDVTEVWRLKRRQRCVVNIAGVYFQCYFLLVLLIAFLFTHNDMLRYLILTLNLGFLMTLNPFFKFDGYWIASDLLGVPNLRKRSKELVSYLYRRIRRKPVAEVPYLLQIRPVEKYCLLVYSVLVNLFMGYYFVYIIPRFLYRFVRSFPDEVEQLVLYLSNNITPPFALFRNIGMQLLFLALIGMMFFKLVQPLVAKYGKRK